MSDIASGSFQEVLDDPLDLPEAQTLLLCSGQVFYDLLQAREESPQFSRRRRILVIIKSGDIQKNRCCSAWL